MLGEEVRHERCEGPMTHAQPPPCPGPRGRARPSGDLRLAKYASSQLPHTFALPFAGVALLATTTPGG